MTYRMEAILMTLSHF